MMKLVKNQNANHFKANHDYLGLGVASGRSKSKNWYFHFPISRSQLLVAQSPYVIVHTGAAVNFCIILAVMSPTLELCYK